jgi:hypothetical protein
MLFELDLIPLWNDDHVPFPWSDFDIEKFDEADLRQIQLRSSPKTQMAPQARQRNVSMGSFAETSRLSAY